MHLLHFSTFKKVRFALPPQGFTLTKNVTKSWTLVWKNQLKKIYIIRSFLLKSLPFLLNSFCFDFLYMYFIIRARTETRSSISDQNLQQCSQGICETVSTPYPFDDYLHKGIKEAYGAPAPSPLHLHNLNSFKYALPESHFLKVHFLTLSLLSFASFSDEVECNVGFWVSSFLIVSPNSSTDYRVVFLFSFLGSLILRTLKIFRNIKHPLIIIKNPLEMKGILIIWGYLIMKQFLLILYME